MRIKKFDSYLVLSILLVWYLPSVIFYQLASREFGRIYSYVGFPALELIITSFAFVFSTMIIWGFVGRIKPYRRRVNLTVFYPLLLKLYVILFFILSCYYFYNYDISFRHKVRLSDQPLMTVMWFYLKPIAVFFLFLRYKAFYQGSSALISDRYFYLLYLSWFISINSSLQVLFFLFVILIETQKYRLRDFGIRAIIKYSLLLLLFFMLVVIVGVVTKVGAEFFFSTDGWIFLQGYFQTILARMSSSAMSVGSAFNHWSNSGILLESVGGEMSTAATRLQLLFGLEFDGEAMQTLSRFNYLAVYASHADRAGLTPGPLASIYYLWWPIGLILMPLYLYVLVTFFKSPNCTNVLYIAIVLYTLIPFLENPVAVMVNPTQPYFFIFYFILLKKALLR